MAEIRIAVIGTGTIIRDYHMDALQRNSQAKVVAAANLHEPSLRALAERFGIPRTYTDFAALAADPDVDAVVIGLPNYLHASVSILMLEAGKHVLCEKPMAMNAAEAQQMIDASRRADRRLMIAHMWRFDHELVWLRDIVQSGAIGDVFKVKSHAIWLYEGPKPAAWFVQPELAGGGSLADMGVHSIDILRFLLNEARPVRVFATAGTFFRAIGVDDTANVMLTFDNGVTGLIETGWYHLFADGLEGYSQVFGTRGYARALPSELHHLTAGVWSVTRPQMPPRAQQCDLPMYRRQVDEFVDCILAGREPVPGGREGLWTMRVLEAAYQSARTGETVQLTNG